MEGAMNLINLTPHSVTIYRAEADPLVLLSAGVARCNTTNTPAGGVGHVLAVHGISVVRTDYGDVTGLPEPVDGTGYVVSGLVLDHRSTGGRDDLFAPGELIRGPDGQPIGCRNLRARTVSPVAASLVEMAAAIDNVAAVLRLDDPHYATRDAAVGQLQVALSRLRSYT